MPAPDQSWKYFQPIREQVVGAGGEAGGEAAGGAGARGFRGVACWWERTTGALAELGGGGAVRTAPRVTPI